MPMDAARRLFIGLLLVTGPLLFGCERRASTAARLQEVPTAPAQESWNVHLSIREDDRPRLQIRAGHLARYEREDSTYTLLRPHPDSAQSRVHLRLYDAQGDSSATVTADRVTYFQEERRFTARGSVQVATVEQKKLFSETLYWNEDERQVRAPGFVRIETPSEHIRGYALEGDENLDNYQLDRVTGQITIDTE